MQVTPSNKALRRYYHSSSFKMAAFFTLLLGLSALILGYFIYDFSKKGFIQETEAAIDSEISSIIELQALMPEHGMKEIIAQRQLRADGQYYLYTGTDDRPLAGNLDALPSDARELKAGMVQFTLSKQTPRMIAAKIHTFADGKRLLVGRDIDAIASRYDTLRVLSVLIILLMLTVVGTSFFISRFVVNRINLIAATARNIIDTGDFSRRISMDSTWDDLSNLASILNALFARTEHLMQGIREVSDNIAHDLRTPLSRLRNKLEALQHGQADEETVKSLIADADHILATFSALLRIANLESGKRHYAFSAVDLHTIAQDVCELYAPLAEEKHIRLQCNVAPYTLQGDRDLLFQALANLVDNAIKFTPHEGEVGLTLSPAGELTIHDNGCGIAEDEHEKVFRRFFRSEASRSTPGNGLGLSMVQAIIQHHKGSIALTDNHPGLRVGIRLANITQK